MKVHIDFTGLPKAGGPFYYHIHENPVNTDTCEDAGGQFDPYKGLSECPVVGDDAACQVGDLSGKHGWINTTCFQTEYFDPFLSLNSWDSAYIVGKSVVLHHSDQTKFACANINIATREQYKQLFDTESEWPSASEPVDLPSPTVSQSQSAAESPVANKGQTEVPKGFFKVLRSNSTSLSNGTIPTTSAGAVSAVQMVMVATFAIVTMYVLV